MDVVSESRMSKVNRDARRPSMGTLWTHAGNLFSYDAAGLPIISSTIAGPAVGGAMWRVSVTEVASGGVAVNIVVSVEGEMAA